MTNIYKKIVADKIFKSHKLPQLSQLNFSENL